jgi:hypothetical protein
LSIYAQEKFASENIKKIFNQLPLDCKRVLVEKKECDCSLDGFVYHIKCEMDGDELNLIGLNVFEDSIYKHNNKAIFSFIEREFLKFILDNSIERVTRREEDHVKFFYSNSFQGRKMLNSPDNYFQNVISDINGISIKQTSVQYNVILINSKGEKIEIEFPIINTLISGKDKKELDDDIFKEFSKDIHITTNIQKNNNSDLSFNNKGNLLVSEGENFLIKDFSSNRYYIKDKDSLKLVFDKMYVEESFSNMFLSYLPYNQNITIDIKFKSYGNIEKNKSLTINNFLSHFDDQFKIFFGIEDSCKDHLRGTVLLYNPALNFLHLMDIKTDATSLFGLQGHLTATFYPYIPTHNIKDLFGKGNNNESILLDDILKENSEK